jgi:ATP-binding cassette subfamily C protein CydC
MAEHTVQALTAGMTLTVLALTWPVLDAPTVTLLALMTLGMNEALGTLPGAFWRVGESQQAAQRLMQLEAAQPADTRHAAPKTEATAANTPTAGSAEEPPAGRVRVVDLICQRQPNVEHALDVDLRAGRPLVIHGASGTGKTSLLATIAGELTPLSGEVWVNNTEVLALPDASRYARVGFLSQSDQLLDLSIREFLQLGLSDVSDQAMRDALHRVDLLETLDNTQEGFDYRLGVGGSRISGGQARRLQLAALLLRDPELVLLDEPFRGLQADLVKLMIERITPWLNQRCCIVVTHDPKALPASWPRQAWPM